MRRLLVFNLRTDADDHILGFTTHWLNALARHYDAVDVLTMHAGRLALADNVRVYSVGRERGYSEVRRLLNFYGMLAGLLFRHRYVACFAHMMPLFAALGAPLLKLWRVPIVVWYTHKQRTRQLEWATRFAYRVVSAVPSSYPIATPKLRPLGHGIRTDFYTPAPSAMPPLQPPEIVMVARLTEIKRQDLLLDACANLDCKLVLVGGIPDGFGGEYARHLQATVQARGWQDKVLFMGEQTPEGVRNAYWRASLALNLSPQGLFDKAALEALACGVPTLVTNPAFAETLGEDAPALIVAIPDPPNTPADVSALRHAIARLLALSPAERARMCEALRAQVQALHSLEALIVRLVRVLDTGESDA